MARTTTLPASLVLCASLVAACGSDREFDRERTPHSDVTPIEIPDLLERPDTYAGQQVVVGGKIVDVWSERLFSVVSQQYLANDKLLVVAKPNLTSIDRAGVGDLGVRVRVSGTLRVRGLETLGRDLQVDLDQVPAHLQKSVFVADSVMIAPTAWR